MAKFTSSNQPKPENRSGGQSNFYKAVIDELHKQFDEGKVEGFKNFESWLVHKALFDGGPYMEAILRKVMPASKATYPSIEFEYDPSWTHVKKADSIMTAMAQGEIPPDVGHMLIDGLQKMLGIEEVTELAIRLEKIEKLLESKQ